ncbi:MAG: DHH family phosphoesterase [Candidatus Methanomethylicaceae archaeon]
MSDLINLIKNFNFITIVCHPNADPDSIGSAYALYSLFKSFGIITKIYIPESINLASKPLLEYLKIDLISEIPEESEIFILVDTSSLDQIPNLKYYIKDKKIPYIIIDHHIPDKETIEGAKLSIIKDSSSTCEIIFDILKNYSLDEKALNALLTGIVYDSRRFLIKPKSSIITAYELIIRGADINKVFQFLSSEIDFSEKMAKLKGCARVRLFKISSWIIAITYVGAFEASVAKTLIDIGADASFVINKSNEFVRITGRLEDSFHNKTGLNLVNDIIKPLIEIFPGQGGGHAMAASVNLYNVNEDLISKLLDLISKKLSIPRNSILEVDIKK